MKKRAAIMMAFFLTLLFSIIILSESVQAIPAFARKYDVKCTRCHTQFPQLNEEGIAFKQRGYREPGEVGDFVWEQEVWPIGGLMKLRVDFRDVTDRAQRFFFDGHELEFFGAGAMAPKVSYFFDFEAHGFTSGTTEFDAKRFFIILDDIVPESRLNIKTGIFINEFLHVSNHNKLTWEGYLADYSRDQAGVEVNGLLPLGRGGLNYALAVVNDERTIGTVNNNLEGFYGWASYTIANQIIGARIYTAPTATDVNHTRFDANVRFNRGPLYLLSGLFLEENVGGVRDLERETFNVDLTYIGKKTALIARWDVQNNPDVDRFNDQILFGAQYHIWPNVKLLAEFLHKVTREGRIEDHEEDRVRVGFIVAF